MLRNIFYLILYSISNKSTINKIDYIINTNKYKNIKNKKIVTVESNIVLYIDTIKNILYQNLLENNVFVKDITNNSIIEISLYKWLTYDNKILDNKDDYLLEWLKLSKQLLTKYNILEEYLTNNDIKYTDGVITIEEELNTVPISYNIRRLKPYIINIENVVDTLLK
jgi:hypothetical protein